MMPPDPDYCLIYLKNEPLLAGRRLRPVQTRRGGEVLFSLFIILLFCAPFWAFVGHEGWVWWQIQVCNSRRVEAEIVKLSESRVSESNSFGVTYRYRAVEGDGVLEGHSQLSERNYLRLRQGQPLFIHYSVHRPWVSRAEWADWQNPLALLCVCGFLTLVSSFPIMFLVWSGRLWLRGWRLQRHGRLLTGELCETEVTKGKSGDERFRLHYAFQSPEGGEILGEATLSTNELGGRRPTRPGTPVRVLYAGPGCYEVL